MELRPVQPGARSNGERSRGPFCACNIESSWPRSKATLQNRLLASSRAAKLLALRKVGQENSGRKTPGIDGVVSISDADRERLKNGFNCGCIFSKAFRCAITGLRLRIPPKSFSTTLSQDKLVTPTIGATSVLFTKWAQAQLRTRARGDQIMASLKDVPFSGL